MNNIHLSTWSMLIAMFGALFLIVLLLNWNSIIKILVIDYHTKFYEKASKSIQFLRILLLKIVGATKGDLEYKKGIYLKSDTYCDNYFINNKKKCIWQLFTYYMFYSFFLTSVAKPIDVELSGVEGRLIAAVLIKDPYHQIINLSILSLTNVISDLVSLTITFIHLKKICISIKNKKIIDSVRFVIIDILCSFFLFCCSQLISNWLYAKSISNPPNNYNFLSLDSMFMPYAFIKESSSGVISFYNYAFPGQLLLTGTVFVPTLFCMLFVFIIIFGINALNLTKKIIEKKEIDHIDNEVNLHGAQKIIGNDNNYIPRSLQVASNLIIGVIASIIGGLIVIYFQAVVFFK